MNNNHAGISPLPPDNCEANSFVTAAVRTSDKQPRLGVGALPGHLDVSTENLTPERARILVIDDEPINARIAEKALRHNGYRQVMLHTDSATAMDIITAQRPDVVLCDVCMPVSGMQILRQVVADPVLVHIPMIMMTASDDETLRAEALELGATDLLAKPLRKTDLLPRVRNALLVRSHIAHLQSYSHELERQVRRRTAELLGSRTELIHCLARLAEYRDNETGRHVIRVGRYSGLLARAIGIDEETAELIEHAAPLHDIGKIGVPDSILLKEGKLTPEEFEIMQRHVALGKGAFEPMAIHEMRAMRSHTILGEMMVNVSTSPLLGMAAQIALTHHERWDGAGYPIGLAGEDIPISGRIVAVADVFDALSNKRPYKPAFPIDKCFAILEEGRGSHFDPQVVDAFKLVRDEILQVRLSLDDID
ncbi:MAG: response regulator [Planctomycetota bacterium]|nr:response regulator [Planctomycetota bacterium]